MALMRPRTIIIVAILVVILVALVPEELRVGTRGTVTISGSILDCNGNPWPGVMEFWRQDSRTGKVSFTSRASASGSYSVRLPLTGRYWVSVYDQEFAMQWPISFVVDITGSGTLTVHMKTPSITSCKVVPNLTTTGGWGIALSPDNVNVRFIQYGSTITLASIRMSAVVLRTWTAIFFPPQTYKISVTLTNTGSSDGWAKVNIVVDGEASHPAVQQFIFIQAGKVATFSSSFQFWDFDNHTVVASLR